MKWITAVEITPGSVGTWVNTDLSAYVPAGATGIIVRAQHYDNLYTTSYAGFRRPGSASTYKYTVDNSDTKVFFATIDSSRFVEIFIDYYVVDIHIYLTGYFEEGEAVFLDAPETVSFAGAVFGSWELADVASTVPSTATAALVNCWHLSGTASVDAKGYNSTLSQHYTTSSSNPHGRIVELNQADKKFYTWRDNGTSYIAIVGYINAGDFTVDNTFVQAPVASGVWYDFDTIPAPFTGAVYQLTKTGAFTTGVRAKGSTFNEFFYAQEVMHLWASKGTDNIIQINGDPSVVHYRIGLLFALPSAALNAICTLDAATFNVAINNKPMVSPDYSVEADIFDINDGSDDARVTIGLAGRVQDDQNLYAAWYNVSSFRWEIFKMVAGIISVVAFYNETISDTAPRKVVFKLSGTSLKLVVDGVTRIDTTDADISAAGSAGVISYIRYLP